MYLSKEESEFKILRQGDILKDVHILGAININGITYGSNLSGEQVSWHITNKPFVANAMVLSHSCEIDPQNTIKMTSIILAPLRDINSATSPEKIKELIQSNFIDDTTEFSYLKYFYVYPHGYMSFSNGAVVDFSKCFSVRNNSYETLLNKKILQLKPEVIDKMSLKLAYYFRRS